MNPATILNVWDKCVGTDQIFKGAALASLTLNEAEHPNILKWSIEKRDVALFNIRKILFGNQFHNLSHCPKCSQTVEWELAFPQLGISGLEEMPDNLEIPIETQDGKLMVRLPNSEDLLENDAVKILQNCIVNNEGVDALNGRIPNYLMDKVNSVYDTTCHASNISYRLNCIECTHEWQVIFDIVSYLWKEIDQWAKGFLQQIYLLAKTFGWSESDIINMPENRRNYYLNLINS